MRHDKRERAPQNIVVVVGRRTVQNGFLAEHVGRELGNACELRPLHSLADVSVPAGALALLDIEGMSVDDIVRYAESIVRTRRWIVALFNVDDSQLQSLVFAGIQGIFSRDTSIEQLIKGIRAMLAGEYWLPRRILAAHYERNALYARITDQASRLTPKESETLDLLVRGNGNEAIARRLGVSPHTVKTHVYNLFRKLGVKNRVQAVNWALRNLPVSAGES